jgi:hypothetical protein
LKKFSLAERYLLFSGKMEDEGRMGLSVTTREFGVVCY